MCAGPAGRYTLGVQVFSIVLPVFAVIALGAALAWRKFLTADALGTLNQLTYWVGLPAYLLASIARAEFGGGRALTLAAVLLGATLATLAIAWPIGRWLLRLPVESRGSFQHAALRGNLAYIGLPVVSLALAAHAAPDAPALHTLALLAMAPTVVAYNVLAVLVLVVGREPLGWRTARSVGGQLLTNPLLLASAAGAALAATAAPVPKWLLQAVEIVGDSAMPLALLAIGGTLATLPLRGKRTAALAASILKVAAAPLLGWGFARLAGLSLDETRIVLLFLASPTAAASFTLAGKLGGDEALAATSVVFSTALSAVSLSAVLALV